MQNDKMLSRKEIDEIYEIDCLFQLSKGYQHLIPSKALQNRLTLPTIEDEYEDMLTKLQVGFRNHLTMPKTLEYYDTNNCNFINLLAPVYSERENGLFSISDYQVVKVPTKSTVSCAFALKGTVSSYRSLTFKYKHNLSYVQNKAYAYTTQKVYYDTQCVFEDDATIYSYYVGEHYKTGKRYSILFNLDLIPNNAELVIEVPEELRPMFIGKGGDNVNSWKKDLHCFIKIKGI